MGVSSHVDPRLAVSLDRLLHLGVVGLDTEREQWRGHLGVPVHRHEHVEVDVDGRARFCVVGERQRTPNAWGIPDYARSSATIHSGSVRRVAGDASRRSQCGVGTGSGSRRPGAARRPAARVLGGASAAGTPTVLGTGPQMLPRRLDQPPEGAVRPGTRRPCSYAEITGCDVPARRARSASVTPPRRRRFGSALRDPYRQLYSDRLCPCGGLPTPRSPSLCQRQDPAGRARAGRTRVPPPRPVCTRCLEAGAGRIGNAIGIAAM